MVCETRTRSRHAECWGPCGCNSAIPCFVGYKPRIRETVNAY